MNGIPESAKSIGITGTPLNSKLIKLFKAQGKTVYEFPVLKTVRSEINDEQVKYFDDISQFDWIIFTDIWTVEYFFELFDKLELDLFGLDGLRICSCGESVADCLRFRQIHSDVIPQKNDDESVFSAIFDYVFDEAGLTDFKFLIISGEQSETELVNLLKKQNAHTHELELYNFEKFDKAEITKLKSLIIGGAIDEFIFNTPEDVFNLSNILGKNIFAEILSEIEIHGLNDVTLQTLSEFDLISLK